MTEGQQDRPGLRTCPRCGAEFVCGKEAGLDRCWCGDLPRVMPVVSDGSGCLCRACLRAAIEDRLRRAGRGLES